MRLLKITATVIVLSIITSCGSSKGYVGDKEPTSELALINGSVNPILVDGKKHKERVLIVRVNQKEVGSYSKGWPKNVKVKEGKNEIEVRHFRTWEYGLEYTGGGAIGGIQAGLDQERTMNHHHYVLGFNVEKNNAYQIDITSNPDDLEEVVISVINSDTNDEIDFDSKKKILNNKTSDVSTSNAKVDELGNGNILIYNAAKGLYKNKLNTGRISIWINEKLLGHVDPQQYIIVTLEKGKHRVKLLHVDVFNIDSEHDIEITDKTKIVQVKPTAFSNRLQVTNILPKKFDRFKNANENIKQ